ncbi:MAG TPA: hypothetical protein VM032_05660 [Vicinamibacterales bacterium]|nr:hypothetical protein [Vicinamibacterales bacterium]
MIQLLLILHGLLAAALLGAITHQAFSVARKPVAPPQSFVGRFRGVNPPTFTAAIVILFTVTFILGGLLYPRYRIDVRPTLEDLQLRAANGVFEAKEHFAAVGFGLLAAYWYYWRPPLALERAAARKYLTWILAVVVWWNFLVGEVLNNIKGLFP